MRAVHYNAENAKSARFVNVTLPCPQPEALGYPRVNADRKGGRFFGVLLDAIAQQSYSG